MKHGRLAFAAATAVVLASLGLATTMDDLEWLGPTVLLVAAVSGACTLARRFAFPAMLVPLTGLLGLVLASTWLFVRDVAVLGVIPGPAAVRAFNDLLLEAGDTIRQNAPPAPTTEGLVVLVAVSIGLLALVVDTIAVTWRSAAVAGLPLLAMYIAPAAILDEAMPLVYFVLAAIGFLALLLVDGRLRLGAWGRVLGRRAPRPGERLDDASDDETLGLVGRRIGAAALGAAVVLPVLIPVGSGLINVGSGGSGEGGDGRTVQTVNPYVSLQRNLNRPVDAVIITYTTDDPTPGYLRMVTLDTFDGVLWNPAVLHTNREQRVSEGMPQPAGLAPQIARESRTSSFAIGELEDNRLPLPYPTTDVQIDGDWRYDEATRNVLSTDDSTTQDAEYDVTHLDVDITGSALARSVPSIEFGDEAYTQLPADLPDVVADTAREVTASATSAYARAVALQDWFRAEFEYDDQTVRESEDPLVDFLEEKAGYCQQFASTMTVMARTLGIPARVNVGFTPGSRGDDGVWSVRWSDSHAWPELFFTGVGWVRFEPTPRGGGGVATPDYATIDATGAPNLPAPGTPGTAPIPGVGRDSITAIERQQLAAEAAEIAQLEAARLAEEAAAARAAANTRRWVPVVVLVLAALLTVPALVRSVRRRRRLATADGGGVDGVRAAWAELRDTYQDIGRTWPESQTPRVLARTLATGSYFVADDRDALDRLAHARERAEYAPRLGPIGDLRVDVERVRAALIAAAGPWQRRRARLMPASAVQTFTVAWGRVTGAIFDRFDDLTRWARRRLSFSR